MDVRLQVPPSSLDEVGDALAVQGFSRLFVLLGILTCQITKLSMMPALVASPAICGLQTCQRTWLQEELLRK